MVPHLRGAYNITARFYVVSRLGGLSRRVDLSDSPSEFNMSNDFVKQLQGPGQEVPLQHLLIFKIWHHCSWPIVSREPFALWGVAGTAGKKKVKKKLASKMVL